MISLMEIGWLLYMIDLITWLLLGDPGGGRRRGAFHGSRWYHIDMSDSAAAAERFN